MFRYGELSEKASSIAVRQIRPPPLSQHLREFASRRDAWVVLARNVIPVVGIYAFGWSAAVSVFNYWFDGLTAVAAIVAAMIPRALRETQSKKDHATLVGNVVRGVFVWLLLVGIVGLPYWIVLIPLHDLLLGNELRRQLAHSPALWFTFGSLAASHFWRAFRMGYDTMPDKELKQRVRWDLYLLILRAIAMFVMAAHGLYFILVPLMALLLSYLEIWPERDRRGFRRSVAALGIRSWRFDIEQAPTLTRTSTAHVSLVVVPINSGASPGIFPRNEGSP